jgi:hypothetical protein
MSIKQILKMRHEHDRDKNLEFEEKWHKYTILNDPKSTYLSVTKLTSFQFPRFDADLVIKRMMEGKNWNDTNKYWGMTPTEIKQLWKNNGAAQSGAGTSLHFNIEQFMNQWLVDKNDRLVTCDHQDLLDSYLEDLETGDSNIENTSPEWKYFLNFVKGTPDLKPYRTEWMIYDDEIKLAGSIDMVYINDDGTLTIYDWKRAKQIAKTHDFNEKGSAPWTKHLPHTNFWHYSLQLNIYKAILQRKYGMTVRDLYLVQLHPENENDNFQVIQCADLQKEVQEIFEDRLKRLTKFGN